MGVVALIVMGYFIADSIHFTGIKPRSINDHGFQANFFANENTESQPAVVLLGGGQWGDYWANEFAKRGMVGLSLPYVGQQALPSLPEEIELEYFVNAMRWLWKQKAVDPRKILEMGASRNAELALVIASTLPDIVGGVIAYAPSSVSWSNTVLPYNSDEVKASWKYQGVDIPYVPMDKISGNDSDKIETTEYWEMGLAKADTIQEALIKVELIKGPILLFSGIDDKVWPAVKMADMIEKRLKDNNFNYVIKNIKYENAGHLISTHPEQFSSVRTGNMNINGKDYEYEFGGTDEGDFNAKKDAYSQLFEFLAIVKNE